MSFAEYSNIESELIEEVQKEDIDEFVKDSAYKGMSPVEAREIFFKIAVDKHVQKLELKIHLKRLLILYLNRGSKISKIQNKTNSESKALQSLNLFGIRETGSISPSDKSLTLSRLASAFPVLTTHLNSKESIRTVGAKPRSIHKCYCWPGGASVIPKSETAGADKLFETWLEWAYNFDSVVNRRPDRTKVKTFASIQRNSDYVSLEDRRSFNKIYQKGHTQNLLAERKKNNELDKEKPKKSKMLVWKIKKMKGKIAKSKKKTRWLRTMKRR